MIIQSSLPIVIRSVIKIRTSLITFPSQSSIPSILHTSGNTKVKDFFWTLKPQWKSGLFQCQSRQSLNRHETTSPKFLYPPKKHKITLKNSSQQKIKFTTQSSRLLLVQKAARVIDITPSVKKCFHLEAMCGFFLQTIWSSTRSVN